MMSLKWGVLLENPGLEIGIAMHSNIKSLCGGIRYVGEVISQILG